MKQILLATHNKAKLSELMLGARSLKDHGWEILSLSDVKVTIDPEETGKTFEDNSILKAKYYGDLTNLPTIADDGGLLIDILNGEPGVKSKRWLGYDATDEELIEYTLKRLKNLPIHKRTAYLQTSLCFYNPQTKQTILKKERIKGYIGLKSSGRPTQGYPYRALFIVTKYNKYYDELTDEEHHAINHRLKALRWLVEKIIKS